MSCFHWMFKGVRSKKKVQSAVATPATDNSSNTSINTMIRNENLVIPNNNINKIEKNADNERHLADADKQTFMSKMHITKKGKNTKFNKDMLLAGAIGTCVGSASGTQLISCIVCNDHAIDDDIFKNYDFPFTNLVFEGGGNKGMAYVGALQVLEEAGITNKITRVAGSSVGAITACLFAVGYTAAELKEFMESDLKKVLVDHKCGYCSLLPNLLTGFGWNPGRKLLHWFGDHLRERTGSADITFREVYHKYNCELCIVVTNLSQMSTEYFHPKTTPNTPIRTAVRMSTALPGVFQSVKYRMNDENTDLYVDGGLLCNYPIHAFDGWWLSMDHKDSFFLKLQPLENYARLFSKNERFGKWNANTLGIMLYSHSETELMKTKLSERLGTGPTPPKDSKLFRKRRKVRMRQAAASKEHKAVVSAIGRFMKELHRLHFDLDGTISLKELRKVFEVSTAFTVEDQMLLFGGADIIEAFNELDKDSDGEITFQELMSFIERKGVNIQTRFLGYTRKEIRSLGEFISTLQTALAINVKRNYVEDRDIERTIGIDTDYIEANDFYLEDMDKKFLLDSGAAAARAFLRHYCKMNHHKRRRNSALLSRDFFGMQRMPSKINVTSVSPFPPEEDVATQGDVNIPLSSSGDSQFSKTDMSEGSEEGLTHDNFRVVVNDGSVGSLEVDQSDQHQLTPPEIDGEEHWGDSDVSEVSLVTFPTLR